VRVLSALRLVLCPAGYSLSAVEHVPGVLLLRLLVTAGSVQWVLLLRRLGLRSVPSLAVLSQPELVLCPEDYSLSTVEHALIIWE
jgi:hypothetical protein